MAQTKTKFDYDFAALVLAEATLLPEKIVADKYGIAVRTLKNYRERMAGDAELARKFHNLQEKRNKKWAGQIPESIRKAMAFLDRCATECDPRIPEQVEQVNAYLQTLLDAQAMQDYLARRFAPEPDETITIVNPNQLPPAGDSHAAGG